MKKQFLLLAALVASVFTTANAQVEYGNVTTPLTGAKTWDFSSFAGLEDGSLVDACTIDNLYFGVSSNTAMYYLAKNARMSMPYSANQTFLDDDATDCVMSFKVPAGKGTVTVMVSPAPTIARVLFSSVRKNSAKRATPSGLPFRIIPIK